MVVSQVPGIEPGCSGRAASALTCRGISPALNKPLKAERCLFVTITFGEVEPNMHSVLLGRACSLLAELAPKTSGSQTCLTTYLACGMAKYVSLAWTYLSA